MSSIKLSSDSTCDLSKEVIEKYSVNIIPLIVNMDDKSFHDGVDIVPEDIYKYVDKTGTLPKTSAVAIAEYEEHFKRLTADGSSVIHIDIGSGFSSTYQNAVIAAEKFPRVKIIDSANLSTGQGLVVVYAAKLIEKGLSPDEIEKECRKITEKVEASFVIDTLKYLYKGGRCSVLSALGANVLKLKPCIEVKEGVMGVGKKYRGNIDSVILQYVRDRLNGRDDIRQDIIFITHTDCNESVLKAVRNEVKAAMHFDEIYDTDAGCTVSNHCGPGTLGILFIRK